MSEATMASSFVTDQPELFAVLVVVVGFLFARTLAGLVDRVLAAVEKTVRRRSQNQLEKFDVSGMLPVLRGLVYYSTLVLFVLLSLRTLSISVLDGLLDTLLGYIPQLLLSGLVILSGYLLGIVARQLVAGISGQTPDQLLPRICQAMVLTVAILTGLGLLAIDISFISNLIVIFVSTILGGLALAFALGSGQLVANILGRRGLERFRVGQRIRIKNCEGRIIEMLNTSVVIESRDGITTIPTAWFAANDVTLLEDDSHVPLGPNDD